MFTTPSERCEYGLAITVNHRTKVHYEVKLHQSLTSSFQVISNFLIQKYDKMLSFRRETALQGTLVLAESGRLELTDNILLIL